MLTVSRDGPKLYAEAKGPGKFDLLPESATRFFSASPEATIAFTVVNGAVTQLVLNVGGRDRTAKRIQ